MARDFELGRVVAVQNIPDGAVGLRTASFAGDLLVREGSAARDSANNLNYPLCEVRHYFEILGGAAACPPTCPPKIY